MENQLTKEEKEEKIWQDLPEEIKIKIKSQIDKFNETLEDLQKDGASIEMELYTEKNKKGIPTGKVFAAFFKQPPIIVAARAMDMQLDKKFVEAGLHMWGSMFMKEVSSPQIEAQEIKYKLPLLGRLTQVLEIVAPDVKKS